MKKIMRKTLILISLMAMLLCGCGNKEQPNDSTTANQSMVTEAPTEVPTATPVPTEEPTEAPTATPAPTQAPTPEPTEVPLPEDRAWIDDIYEMFEQNDTNGLREVLLDAELAGKIAPYAYEGWSGFENEKAYRLVTTDGKIIGVVLYDENGYFSNSIFYCEDKSRDYGFSTIETGDKIFHIYKSTTNGDILYDWYDGVMEYYSDGTVVDPTTYGGYLLVWHM